MADKENFSKKIGKLGVVSFIFLLLTTFALAGMAEACPLNPPTPYGYIKVSESGSLNSDYIFRVSNSKEHFSVAMDNGELHNGSLKIIKIQIPCGNPLSNFSFFHVTGPSTDIWVTTGPGGYVFIDNLPFGDYTITEQVPDGWEVLTDNPQYITIDSEETIELTFKNKLLPKYGSLKIIKLQDPCGNPLPNFSFHITGPSTDIWVTTGPGGYVFIDNLPFGDYTITEQVPDGWEVLTDNPQYITIDSEETIELTFKNKLLPKYGSLKIIKLQDPCGNPLPNFSFHITGPSTDIWVTTGPGGYVFVDNLPFGDYTITEQVPDGWEVLTPNPQYITIDSEETIELTFKNKLLPKYGSLKIIKLQDPCGNPLPNFSFHITGPSTDIWVTTGPGGYVFVDNLPFGDYTITEQVPDGWEVLTPNPQYITIDSEETIELTFKNKLLPKYGSLKIIKLQDPCGNPLPNFSFHITGPSTDIWVTTGPGGYVFIDNLPFGDYTITEQVPDGWEVLTDNPQYITIDSEETIELTFKNKKKTPPGNGGARLPINKTVYPIFPIGDIGDREGSVTVPSTESIKTPRTAPKAASIKTTRTTTTSSSIKTPRKATTSVSESRTARTSYSTGSVRTTRTASYSRSSRSSW